MRPQHPGGATVAVHRDLNIGRLADEGDEIDVHVPPGGGGHGSAGGRQGYSRMTESDHIMWSTFLPTINIGYGGHTVSSIVYDETDDGSYLFCVNADKPWADDLLAATLVTVTRNVTRAAASEVVA
jgi:hypothetical protein